MRFKLATIALLAVSSVASAKDGAYVSGNVGVGGITYNTKVKSGDSKYDSGFRGGFAFGYNFGESFALEFNIQHQSNNMQNANPKYTINSTIGFVNGYYFLPVSQTLKPYIGVGVGYGSIALNGKSVLGDQIELDHSMSASIGVLALQGLLGVKYELTESFDVFADLTYTQGFMLSSTSSKNDNYVPYGLRLGGAYKL